MSENIRTKIIVEITKTVPVHRLNICSLTTFDKYSVRSNFYDGATTTTRDIFRSFLSHLC